MRLFYGNRVHVMEYIVQTLRRETTPGTLHIMVLLACMTASSSLKKLDLLFSINSFCKAFERFLVTFVIRRLGFQWRWFSQKYEDEKIDRQYHPTFTFYETVGFLYSLVRVQLKIQFIAIISIILIDVLFILHNSQ